MTTDQSKDCFQKYQYHVGLAERIEERLPDDKAWSCVVRFYAALHLVTAYLIDKTDIRFEPSASAHLDRRRAMEKCPELRDAPRKYRELKDLSESVRYDAGFEYASEHHDNSKSCLRRIIAIVEPKIRHE